MDWQFWRKRRGSTEAESTSSFDNRFAALERSIEMQRIMLDERTRVMADALSTELRALGRIMVDLSHNMADLGTKLDEMKVQQAAAAPFPERVRDRTDIEELAILAPPKPANDPPAALRPEIDPMLLDALAKGRIAFDITTISSIPPRTPLLAMMRFSSPLPETDFTVVDRLAELFPDAALLLDRLMIDAAASMIRAGRVPPDLPLLVPISPITPTDAAHALDFRRRFDRVTHKGGVVPLLSEPGWIALIEAGKERMEELAGPRASFAVRVSGTRRIDHAAIGTLGARYVLAPAAVLGLSGHHPLAPDIHGADVARLFARAGVGLVAEHVPDQVSVLGLLRNGIGMGWGPALHVEPGSPALAQNPTADDDPAKLDYRAYLRRATS
jgi:hypothetical protein